MKVGTNKKLYVLHNAKSFLFVSCRNWKSWRGSRDSDEGRVEDGGEGVGTSKGES